MEKLQVDKGIGETLVDTAEHSLDFFPVEEEFEVSELTAFLQSSLPPPMQIFSKELYKMPVLPPTILKDTADLCGCPILRDTTITMYKISSEERNNWRLMLVIWLAVSYDLGVNEVGMIKESFFKSWSYRHAPVETPSQTISYRDVTIERNEGGTLVKPRYPRPSNDVRVINQQTRNPQQTLNPSVDTGTQESPGQGLKPYYPDSGRKARGMDQQFKNKRSSGSLE